MSGQTERSFHFIINPVAGRGRAGKLEERLVRQMENARAKYTISTTSGPGDAGKLAAQMAGQYDVTVSVGGDGTINEIINGLRDPDAVLAIIPAGSGNDFVKVIGHKIDLDESLRLLVSGEPCSFDLGRANDRLFTNSFAMGIDAAVARTMNRARWLPSTLAYHYGVFTNLFFYKNKTIRWKADDREGETKANLAAVMNGHSYGGGYKIAPKALPDDGLLDLIIMGDYGIGGRILHLPKLKKGKHLALPKINYIQAKKIELISDEPMPVAVDGEMLPDSSTGTDVSIEVVPNGITVLCPPVSG